MVFTPAGSSRMAPSNMVRAMRSSICTARRQHAQRSRQPWRHAGMVKQYVKDQQISWKKSVTFITPKKTQFIISNNFIYILCIYIYVYMYIYIYIYVYIYIYSSRIVNMFKKRSCAEWWWGYTPAIKHQKINELNGEIFQLAMLNYHSACGKYIYIYIYVIICVWSQSWRSTKIYPGMSHAMPPVISPVRREKEQPAKIQRSQNQQMSITS